MPLFTGFGRRRYAGRRNDPGRRQNWPRITGADRASMFLDVSGGPRRDGQRHAKTEQGYYVPMAKGRQNQVVKCRLIGVGHITEPEYADRNYPRRGSGMAAVGTLLLANPDFPMQAAEKPG